LKINSKLSKRGTNRTKEIQMKMGFGRKEERCHKGYIVLNYFEEKKKDRRGSSSVLNLERLFWPLLHPKSTQKLICLHMSKRKSMHSNKENEEQNEFPMIREAHGKTC
jgi:hypothetical protein